MIRWNEKYGIKFLRISSTMFPFASHAKYGYNLDFAAGPLREAGRLAMKFRHRLTTHPGQVGSIFPALEGGGEGVAADNAGCSIHNWPVRKKRSSQHPLETWSITRRCCSCWG